MQYNQMDTFTMITFFLGNMIKKTILLCNVSFHVPGNVSWQLTFLPKLRFFYFSVKAVSIGITKGGKFLHQPA